MNLLFSFADLELWQWIAIAAIVVVAIILIVLIVVWAVKRSKAKKAAKNSAGKPAEKTAARDNTVSEEKPAPSTKTAAAEKPAEKPVEKPAPRPQPELAAQPVVRDTGKVYHISKRRDDNKWQIKAEGGARAIKLFLTQAEAIAYAKQLAQNQDARIMIHKEDGSFRKLTY